MVIERTPPGHQLAELGREIAGPARYLQIQHVVEFGEGGAERDCRQRDPAIGGDLHEQCVPAVDARGTKAVDAVAEHQRHVASLCLQ